MEDITTSHKPSPAIFKLRLSAIALASLGAVLMVTMLIAATGDNIADAVLGQIDFSHNGLNNPGAASLDSPGQMAIDLSGSTEHLYVVDASNSRILGWNDATSFANGQNADIEIGQPDFETTLCNSGVAGGDLAGLGPDSLCLPGGVAVDSAGNLYVADTFNSRVLEYNQPFMQAMSVGFAANTVFGQGGSFTQAACASTATGLCAPQGVALDSSNNLFVADAGNNRVLQYSPGGGATAQLVFGQGATGTNFTDNDCDVGEGFASLNGMCNPLSVAVDGLGNLYVGDDGDHRVLAYLTPLGTAGPNPGTPGNPGDVTPDLVFGQGSTGTDFTDIQCYDGNGGDPAPSADGLCNLSGIALDSAGDLFVTDINNSRVLEYLNPLALCGGSPGTPGSPGDVTADVVFGQNGSFATGVCGGTRASGIAASGSVLCLPDGVTLDGAGDVFVADASNNRVLEYSSPLSSPPLASAVLGQADLLHNGVNNPTAAALQAPEGIAIDSSATPNHLYVADSVNNRVLGWADAAGFANDQPADIVIGQPDALSVNCNDGVVVGDSNGIGPDSLCNPADVAVDGSGDLYVADAGNNRVLEYLTPFAISSPIVGQSASQVWGQNGSFTATGCNLGTETINASSICFPEGVTVDTSGDLYVSDTDNNRVLEFNSGDKVADNVFGQGGIFTGGDCNGASVINADSLCGPRGLTTDPDGDLFAADSNNFRVLEYLNPLAGGGGTPGTPGSSGDTTADLVFGQGASGTSFTTAVCSSAAGPAPSATGICNPVGLSLDSPGDLIVADQTNNRVLEYNQPLATANVTAALVLGQGSDGTDFTDSACANSGSGNPAPSATGMCQPAGVAMDTLGNLYTADEANNRVLLFDAPIVPGPTPTATATDTATATATDTPTATATATNTATATQTATATATPTATETATPTVTGTATSTPTATPTATAVPAMLAVSPNRLVEFGKVVFGEGAVSKPQQVTIMNKSKTTPVTFSSIATSGDFAMVSGCGATIGPKSTCKVTIRFLPTGFGGREGTLTINSNASNSPRSVDLTGSGTHAKR